MIGGKVIEIRKWKVANELRLERSLINTTFRNFKDEWWESSTKKKENKREDQMPDSTECLKYFKWHYKRSPKCLRAGLHELEKREKKTIDITFLTKAIMTIRDKVWRIWIFWNFFKKNRLKNFRKENVKPLEVSLRIKSFLMENDSGVIWRCRRKESLRSKVSDIFREMPENI